MKAICIFFASVGVLYGCGGSGGEREEGPGTTPVGGGSGTLKVTIFDRDAIESRIAGVTVVLHGLNKVSVQESRTTDETGSVEFGSIGRDRVTYSIYATDGVDNATISTLVDVPLGHWYHGVTTIGNDGNDPAPQVQVRFDGLVNSSASSVELNPISPVTRSGNSASAIGPVRPFPQGMQDDGTLSILGLVREEFDSEILEYGFLIDQPVTDGAVYEGSFGLFPEDVRWEVDASGSTITPIVLAQRKGRFVVLYPYSDPGTEGVWKIPAQFPAESWAFIARYQDDSQSIENTITVEEDFSEQGVRFSFPEFRLSSARYESDQKTVNFSVENSQLVDDVNLIFQDGRSAWAVFMPPYLTSFTFPDLPDELPNEDIRSRLERSPIKAIVAYDADFYSGYIDEFRSRHDSPEVLRLVRAKRQVVRDIESP